ncbi:MAG TPA: hypothetical protein VMA54_04235 [Steroidobacteraceae bacterium]|nr:hypothetical protein [Steroidobacteraceae bacterium]
MTTRFVSSRSRSGTDAQQAYDTLKEHEREQHLADESQMTAELYSDPAWNWGAWGPWGPGWGGLVAHNDCVEECRGMADDSVDLIVTSIPFSNHCEYTPSYNDFGHTEGDEHFFQQMDFLTPQLLRILKPGRLACVHVKDRILFGSVTGFGTPTVNPFHAKCIMHYQRQGFAFIGMITVVTDVVRENNQSYRLGWSEQCKDGTKMGVGPPEYILLLRKLPTDRSKAHADLPVVKSKDGYSRARWQVDAHAFWRSSG